MYSETDIQVSVARRLVAQAFLGDMDAQSPSTDWLDEMVLVVDAEKTRIQAAKRAKDSLQRAGVHVTGVVLANRREHIPRWLYQRL